MLIIAILLTLFFLEIRTSFEHLRAGARLKTLTSISLCFIILLLIIKLILIFFIPKKLTVQEVAKIDLIPSSYSIVYYIEFLDTDGNLLLYQTQDQETFEFFKSSVGQEVQLTDFFLKEHLKLEYVPQKSF